MYRETGDCCEESLLGGENFKNRTQKDERIVIIIIEFGLCRRVSSTEAERPSLHIILLYPTVENCLICFVCFLYSLSLPEGNIVQWLRVLNFNSVTPGSNLPLATCRVCSRLSRYLIAFTQACGQLVCFQTVDFLCYVFLNIYLYILLCCLCQVILFAKAFTFKRSFLRLMSFVYTRI